MHFKRMLFAKHRNNTLDPMQLPRRQFREGRRQLPDEL